MISTDQSLLTFLGQHKTKTKKQVVAVLNPCFPFWSKAYSEFRENSSLVST